MARRCCSGWQPTTTKLCSLCSYGQAILQWLAANNYQVAVAIALDMISYHATTFGVLLESTSTNALLLDEVESLASAHSLAVSRSYDPFGSDHMPFINAGLPPFLPIDHNYIGH